MLGTEKQIAERERAPIYIIGEVTGDQQFTLENPLTGEKPIDISLASLFGDPPRTIMNDSIVVNGYIKLEYSFKKINELTDPGSCNLIPCFLKSLNAFCLFRPESSTWYPAS